MKRIESGVAKAFLAALALCSAGFLNTGCSSKSSPASPANNSPAPLSYSLATFFGASGSVTMGGPLGVGVSGSTLWVTNNLSSNFQAWTAGGSPVMTITANISGKGASGVAIGPDGYVYVACEGAEQVNEFSPEGAYETNFGNTQLSTTGKGSWGVAVGQNYAYASSTTIIFGYPISGTGASKSFGSPVSFGYTGVGQLTNSIQICLDNSGNVYSTDYSNNRIVKYNATGTYQMAATLAGGGGPTGVAVDGSGNIFALDVVNGEIQVFNSSGAAATIFGQGDLAGAVAFLQQIALDGSGNLYATDYSANQIVEFSKN